MSIDFISQRISEANVSHWNSLSHGKFERVTQEGDVLYITDSNGLPWLTNNISDEKTNDYQ